MEPRHEITYFHTLQKHALSIAYYIIASLAGLTILIIYTHDTACCVSSESDTQAISSSVLTCDVVRVFGGCGQWWGTRTPGTAGGHGGHESRYHQPGYACMGGNKNC